MNPMVRTSLVLGLLGAAITTAAVAGTVPVVPGRNLQLKAHFNDFPYPGGPYGGTGYASCWGYVHGDGREYAIIGCNQGTAIYNVTDPDNAYFVAMIPGPPSLWREMKSYRNWIYSVTEGAGGTMQPLPGVQIIRMTDPEHPVLVGTFATGFQRSHTVSVDTTRALLYCSGTHSSAGANTAMRILSLANPEAPSQIAAWPNANTNNTFYVHDCVPIGNRLYASSIYVGVQRVLNVTNPAAPTELASWTYPGAYLTHNAWPDATGNFVYVTDEQNGQPLRVFNISNLASPTLVGEWTANPQAIAHNAHVNGNELWVAHYTEGIRVLDITDPAHPAEYGWSDTYPGPSGGYSGVWGVYPYFPSGTVIASDMQTGLYVYRPQRNYGRVRVEVTETHPARYGGEHSGHAMGLEGATVYLTSQSDSVKTSVDGIVQFAPNVGSHVVVAKKFGYHDATAIVEVAQGSSQTVVLNLIPRAAANLSGVIRNDVDNALLAGAEVNLRWTPIHEHTNPAGQYSLLGVPDDEYRLDVRRPGFIPGSFVRRIGPGFDGTQNFDLTPAALWDPLATNAGWTIGAAGDEATAGQWVRVEPYGTGVSAPMPYDTNFTAIGWSRASRVASAALRGVNKPGPGLLHEGHEAEGATPGQVQPDTDRSPDPDSLCFVTGNAPGNAAIDAADIDAGRTTLTSPAYNTLNMSIPTIGVWVWFYSQFRSDDDWLAVSISGDNGVNWVPVETLRGIHNHWEEIAIPVANYVTPSSQVRVRFVAADLGAGSVVEAGIDDISVYDAATGSLGIPGEGDRTLEFRAPWPNPSTDGVHLSLGLPGRGAVDVEIVDIAGRRVRTLFHGSATGVLALRWDGTDEAGSPTPAGVYFARARTDFGGTVVRFARIR
jgi:choice-of-anchor B domain-containing protein